MSTVKPEVSLEVCVTRHSWPRLADRTLEDPGSHHLQRAQLLNLHPGERTLLGRSWQGSRETLGKEKSTSLG